MFVYSVSHDLRTPLVNLQGFSKELRQGGRGPARAAGRRADPGRRPGPGGRRSWTRRWPKSVGFIQTAVGRLGGIIDALLRLSRAGRVEYRREAVDVAAGRPASWARSRGRSPSSGRRSGSATCRRPGATATAVEQVFANLVGERPDLPGPGPARAGRGRVPPPDAGRVGCTYFVRDNGLGIPAAAPAEAFQALPAAPPGGRGRARAWGWRSSAAWSSGTAGGSGSSPRRARGVPSSSPLPAPPAGAGTVESMRTRRAADHPAGRGRRGPRPPDPAEPPGGRGGQPDRPRQGRAGGTRLHPLPGGVRRPGRRTARSWSCSTSTCPGWTGSRCCASSRPTRRPTSSRSSC